MELGGSCDFSYQVDLSPVQMWGINFAGKVLIKRGGQERAIYLPGTRTYDPAGVTGKLLLAKLLRSRLSMMVLCED